MSFDLTAFPSPNDLSPLTALSTQVEQRVRLDPEGGAHLGAPWAMDFPRALDNAIHQYREAYMATRAILAEAKGGDLRQRLAREAQDATIAKMVQTKDSLANIWKAAGSLGTDYPTNAFVEKVLKHYEALVTRALDNLRNLMTREALVIRTYFTEMEPIWATDQRRRGIAPKVLAALDLLVPELEEIAA